MIKDRISEPGGLISDIVGHLLHMGIWVLALGIAEGTDNAFGPFGWLGYLGIIFASAIIILFGGVLSFRTSINGCFEELDRILTTPRTFQAGYEWLNQRLESWRESLVWRCLGYCLICAFAVATATIQWESLATILPENRFLSVLYMIVVFHAIFITSIVAASYVVGRLAGTIRQGGGNPGQG